MVPYIGVVALRMGGQASYNDHLQLQLNLATEPHEPANRNSTCSDNVSVGFM